MDRVRSGGRPATLALVALLATAGPVAPAVAQLQGQMQGQVLGQLPPAQAVANPLVGIWTSNVPGIGGQPPRVEIVVFAPDGRVQHRVVGQNGQADMFGRYRVSPDGRFLQTMFTDFAPKTTCTVSFCGPAPTPENLFRQFDLPVTFQGTDRMQVETPDGVRVWTRRR
ncbi:hypothetical protein [Zavarzinia sp. CC-PAN008]|uniref:hypothetical protein n=1 Tax=Zavarzinia sp. CC-PAN008 TaxID=3243332 RepID=UPI003F74A33B